MTIGGSKIDGIFADEAELILQTIPNGRRVEIITGERYYTGVDDGGGILLAGGNYANPISSGGGGSTIITGDETITTGDYIVTADSVLTLEDGALGDSLTVYSLYGVSLVTINATQDFNDGTATDSQFLLTTPNVKFTFTNNGTEWEI